MVSDELESSSWVTSSSSSLTGRETVVQASLRAAFVVVDEYEAVRDVG